MTSRLLSLFFAFLAGAILLIPFVIIWILVKLTSPGSAIHWSKRVGRNNALFLMPKFRTMKENTPQMATHLLTDGPTFLTPIGNFLRKSSLDEIPQLWAVIVGDMNIVGPRPALFNQEDLIKLRTKHQVHTIRPGITGWAQINGRDELSIEGKVKFDCDYLNRQSVGFDIKIICFTVYKVLLRANISH